MATKHILDTHALIWHLEGNPLLGSAAKSIIDDPESELVLPVIALAEACYVVEKGRTGIPSVADLLQDVVSDPRVEVYPLVEQTVVASTSLTAIPEMHDRLITATALHIQQTGHTVKLITKDRNITAAGALAVVW